MIVFNTAEKLATKTLERLEWLNIAQLESSLRQCVVRNKNNFSSKDYSKYNTIDRVGDCTFCKTNNLLIDVVEVSKGNKHISSNLYVWSKDVKGFNSFDILKDKSIDKINNLLVHIIEKSNVKNAIRTKTLIIKPRKEYKATLKLIKTYSNQIKY